MTALLLSTAALALRVPTNAFLTRRALVGGGLAASVGIDAASVGIDAANAIDIDFSKLDPIGAYNIGGKSGDVGGGPVPANFNGKPNTGILLLRECFDGGLPAGGLVDWYEEHLADDFKASFAGGKVILDKPGYIAVTADLLKSFPDFVYTRDGPIAYADSPTKVKWTAIVKGTHTGAPYSPLPGVPAVAAKKVAVQNDPEKVTVDFASGTGLKKIAKLTVDAVPGGKGFSGPVGFYLQIGGDPAKLPPP